MKIDEDTVTKIAKLARIKVADDEKAHYAKELTAILDWAEQLQELNTDDTPMMTSVAYNTLPMREDNVSDGGYTKEILSNAPQSDFDCFVVPKVVDQG
ncbi:MAG: Asp-tRNA(Asn)/Glu-tRNA(Gln) amidotransferase GatCAB subunit C [Alphaproteobacteria bacterium CG11_big_fil_rev_8_21_14_0_20_44_7]|nr:MAG: Asp-tRNA(Asn)/Glu-tRNA(Gln) amidotransferase GatCAB subunit C [Alphaproteobacteria bacterium CG11_big_fil_rev_8_21_14_0_20_44_7]